MSLAAWILVVAVGASPGAGYEIRDPSGKISQPLHADKKAWSKGGWGSLRWGMGAADVLERVRPVGTVDDFTHESVAEPVPGFLLLDVDDPEYGRLASLFVFQRGGLRELHLRGRSSSKSSSALAAARERLGEPASCETFLDGEGCRWKTRYSQIELSTSDVGFEIACGEAERRLQSTQRVAVGLLRSERTDPATWSRLGVQGLRLGMGIRDAVEALHEPCGQIACGFTCELQQPSDRVQCDAQRPRSRPGQGRLEVQWISFTTEGRLVTMQLHFASRSREEIEAELADLRRALAPLLPEGESLDEGEDGLTALLEGAMVHAFTVEGAGGWELAVGVASRR